ncbi:DUF2510 domain-containing protein [Streptomyces sp. NPDC050560]|uniref:DUF2510 domain-containing protein n=1 Tax=Streptomyces sp. NPDC050560 TaxID=3365630 RepID=UPI003796FAE7
MTQATPPGWYPDPGQTNEGPRTERWWDGSAWTERIRTEAAPGWGPPGYPPLAPPPAGRSGARRALAAAIAVVVLAGVGVGAYALSTDDGGEGSGDTAAGDRTPGGKPTGPDGGDGGGGQDGGGGGLPGDPSQGPGEGDGGDGDIPGLEKGYATDLASGISIKVPEGWKGQSGAAGAGVTTGSYPCPGDSSQSCVRGGVFSSPAQVLKLTSTKPEAAAKEDIEKNAEESYGDVYGGVSKHDELASKAVEVAGQQGYLVRWKVTTSKGDDGYVESLAFPSPASEKVLVVVRFGFDATKDSPGVGQMDSIAKDIKKAAAGAGGSGKGA